MHRIWLLSIGLLAACATPRPDGLGIQDGKLAPCPDKPNCVSSFAPPGEHRVEPIAIALPSEEPFAPVKAVLGQLGQHELGEEGPDYLHVVFTSRVFRFKDDLELLYDRDAGLLHLRSASRLGHSDLGVNRKRAESLAQLLEKHR
ncbi:MAG: DUF1499 domain-containing protein [bacterium]|nr:DUF1499 domain-containing protein [bacterium]